MAKLAIPPANCANHSGDSIEPKPEHKTRAPLPSVEKVCQELGKAQSIDDFFGKEGIFARLFTETLEQMLETELTAQLSYEKYEAKCRNSGNSRNGKTSRKPRTSSIGQFVAFTQAPAQYLPMQASPTFAAAHAHLGIRTSFLVLRGNDTAHS